MQKNVRVLVAKKRINDIAINAEFFENISPIRDIIFTKRKVSIDFLFPKFFRKLELLNKRINVKTEAVVYKIPTNFSSTKFVRNVEFMYAGMAM